MKATSLNCFLILTAVVLLAANWQVRRSHPDARVDLPAGEGSTPLRLESTSPPVGSAPGATTGRST